MSDTKKRRTKIDPKDEKTLTIIGELAKIKYDEFVVRGGSARGYNLHALKGSLQYKTDLTTGENEYWLQGDDDHWTKVAVYFEYGTGIYNTRRAGRYHAGYIKPVAADYLTFLSKRGGDHWVRTDKVTGVHPIFAMTKAIKYIEYHHKRILKEIGLQND